MSIVIGSFIPQRINNWVSFRLQVEKWQNLWYNISPYDGQSAEHKSGLLTYTVVETVFVNFSSLVQIKFPKTILVFKFQRAVNGLPELTVNYITHCNLTCQFDIEYGPPATHNTVECNSTLDR